MKEAINQPSLDLNKNWCPYIWQWYWWWQWQPYSYLQDLTPNFTLNLSHWQKATALHFTNSFFTHTLECLKTQGKIQDKIQVIVQLTSLDWNQHPNKNLDDADPVPTPNTVDYYTDNWDCVSTPIMNWQPLTVQVISNLLIPYHLITHSFFLICHLTLHSKIWHQLLVDQTDTRQDL